MIFGIILAALGAAIVVEHAVNLRDPRTTRRQARSDRQYFWVG